MTDGTPPISLSLNARALELCEAVIEQAQQLRVQTSELPDGGRIVDCGVKTEGSLAAGLALARVCTSDLADVTIIPSDLDGISWPAVSVRTDHPVEACLLSQYAGWQVATDDYFAIGSGPMRAVSAREELFEKLNYRETASKVAGVLEAGKLPSGSAIQLIAEKTGVQPDQITLLVAPTSSLAGTIQVVARSVETALHKLFELGFDVMRIQSGFGTAPLPPVAADDLTGIGRTNDAILYGGRVTLWVDCDDGPIEAMGPHVPASASASYGKPFLEIFEEAGRDFYKIDPHLFSPAEIVFHNIRTGHAFRFGQCAPDVLRKSFGV